MATIKTIFCASFFLLINQSMLAQGNPQIQDSDKLDKKKEVLMKAHPHIFDTANVIDVVKISETHSKVIYIRDSIYHEAIINSGRKDMLILETAQLIATDALPDVVRDSLRKNADYEDYKIDRVFLVRRPQGKELYRLDLIKEKENVKIKTVYLDLFGHPASNPF